MNAEEIKKLLPHRDPFLFIDKVLDLSAEHIVAERYVSPEESFFKGQSRTIRLPLGPSIGYRTGFALSLL